MKRKLSALLLILALLFSSLTLSGCSLFNQPDTEDPDLETGEGGEEEKKEPYTPPASSYNPDNWFTDPVIPPTPDKPNEPELTFEEKLAAELTAAITKIDFCIESYDGKFPGAYSNNHVYKTTGNTAGWIQGFWTGILWQAYEITGDEKYATLADTHVDSFYKRIDEKLGVDNHDMGFLYTPSCIAAYKLKGDETARAAAVMAADNLLTRYHSDPGFIQAWGEVGAAEEYRLIIDCLMNLPLLYWASETTGDEKYSSAADSHLALTLATIYRDDGSTYHTYFFDPETKLPSHGATKQGDADDSTWARGQSWAMYGPVLAYSYTGNADALAHFKAAADCFINNLPSDYVPYWDFNYGEGSGEPRDASAGAIAVCALLEGCKYLEDSDPDKARYLEAAKNMTEAMIDHCSATGVPTANGLLIGATQNRKTEKGVEEMTPYGDYFYLEALHRMSDPEWEAYW